MPKRLCVPRVASSVSAGLFMEGAAWGQGKRIEELDMNEMQQLWDQAKMLHVGEASHD